MAGDQLKGFDPEDPQRSPDAIEEAVERAEEEEAEGRWVGMEDAARPDAGVVRRADVEGGEELSIGGSPPSGAGGEVRSPAPNQEDLRRR